MNWFREWLKTRTDHRLVKAAIERLEQTSPHLLADIGVQDEPKRPNRNAPKIDDATEAETRPMVHIQYDTAAE